MDHWTEAYIRLGLRLERLFPGYVDAYYGPPALAESVAEEASPPPGALVQAAVELNASLPQQGYDEKRTAFLQKQLRAVETAARRAAGEKFPYREEVERCFDIPPRWVDEERFLAAHRALEEILPGDGPIGERLQTYRNRFVVPEERILPLIDLIQDLVRRRTRELVDLPEGESVEVCLVKHQPWAAYNWYLGQYRSRIEINTDLPTRANHLLGLFSHEAYPGHHTEAALKEHRLYHGQGCAEQSIALINTPENVLAEGIANVGQSLLFDDMERMHWLNKEFYPQAGLEPVDPEQALRLEQAARDLRYISGNATLLLHEQGRPAEEVVDYLERYTLRSRQEAEHMLPFLQGTLTRSYVYCYTAGEDLIKAALDRVEDRAALFCRLLTEPWTPAELASIGA